jgi:glycolate oxidase FAD binding subunit
MLNRPAAQALGLNDAPWTAVIGFEDMKATVAWQVEHLGQELAQAGQTAVEARVGASSSTVWQGLTEFRAWPEAALTFKANLLPQATADFLQHAGALPDGLRLQAHAGNGIVIGHAPPGLTPDRAGSLLADLGRRVGPHGNLVVLRCPSDWKQSLPVWGLPRGDRELMRSVKQALDPRGLFNPGRFVV